jgi:alanine dehydrogenase
MSSNPLLGADLYATAALLWDESLFFECHEWLEQNYRTLQGQEKKVLQAMIRTAGTFELLTYNRKKAAVSVATKALSVLEPHSLQVPESFNIQPKIARLKTVIKDA